MAASFNEMKKNLTNLSDSQKRVAVVSAEDEEVLAAIREAKDDGVADGILVGDKQKIAEVAEKHKISLDGFEIIHEPVQQKAATLCTSLIREGRAAAIMKGSLDSAKFMKAILNKETGIRNSELLSLVGVFELVTYPKLLFVTDPGINIAPNLTQKVKIIENAVSAAHKLGVTHPLVACCAAVEKVNAEAMPATADAACLAMMSQRGQFTGCTVDGPFGLDNAVSKESARLKKINSPVAGNADIILCNDIESGNYLYKALVFLAGAKNATTVVGASAPVIMTSRADSHETKYLSIIFNLMQSSASN